MSTPDKAPAHAPAQSAGPKPEPSTAPSSAGAAPKTNCKVILAGTLSKPLLAEVAESLKELGREQPPKLVGFLTNNEDPDARTYADWTDRTFKENGFAYELRVVDKDELEEKILEANQDDGVDGIIVYYPIFRNRQDQYIQQLVDPAKDVEALSHRYMFNMYQNIRYLDGDRQQQKSLLPCTPLAVVKILENLRIYNTTLEYGMRLWGRTVTVVNRSEVVGRPLAALLANDGARVFSVDVTGVQEFTRGPGLVHKRHQVRDCGAEWGLKESLAESDVVITGVPGDDFKIPVEYLKEGVTCINFSTQKNFPPAVKEKASIYVPAIGKMTITILMRNLLRLITNAREAKASNPLFLSGAHPATAPGAAR